MKEKEKRRGNRISVSLSDGSVQRLNRYAGSESKQSPPATVAAYLVERALDELEQKGMIPKDGDNVEIPQEDFNQIIEFVKLLTGDRTDRQGVSFVLLGELLGIEAAKLNDLYSMIIRCREEIHHEKR